MQWEQRPGNKRSPQSQPAKIDTNFPDGVFSVSAAGVRITNLICTFISLIHYSDLKKSFISVRKKSEIPTQ